MDVDPPIDPPAAGPLGSSATAGKGGRGAEAAPPPAAGGGAAVSSDGGRRQQPQKCPEGAGGSSNGGGGGGGGSNGGGDRGPAPVSSGRSVRGTRSGSGAGSQRRDTPESLRAAAAEAAEAATAAMIRDRVRFRVTAEWLDGGGREPGRVCACVLFFCQAAMDGPQEMLTRDTGAQESSDAKRCAPVSPEPARRMMSLSAFAVLRLLKAVFCLCPSSGCGGRPHGGWLSAWLALTHTCIWKYIP